MHEHDRAALLQLLVSQGKRLTESDGGGLLLLDEDEQGVPLLRGNVFDSDSLSVHSLRDVTFALDHNTVIGHSAMTREPAVIRDIHKLPEGLPFRSSGDFQRKYDYYVRSLLVVPMVAHDKSLLGVLVLFNRKSNASVLIKTEEDAERYVLPYSERQVRLAKSLASQAAVSIENTQLHEHIQHIIESLVKAAVSAIDARDPTTAGHSLRVAAFVTNFADVLEHSALGQSRHVHFTEDEMRELYFSALLHDIGKVGVREDVLMKAKKLSPELWERVDARFDLIGRTIELESAKQRLRACAAGAGDASELARIDAALADRLRDIARMRQVIRAANDPHIEEGPSAAAELTEIAKHTFVRADGTTSPYLTAEELCFLKLPMGTLDAQERAEVESHVSHTAEFLARIPWTDDLKNLVKYAGGHHEKLDGSGYPNRLKGDEIAIQTRLITLADIYDALTAEDRPYKPAVSSEKAIEILRSDADAGLLDGGLVDLLANNLETITRRDPLMATEVSQLPTPSISA
jgi:HD-GYP domain-containing protein (c-di-GMP phosphodiesterase class II)